MIAVAEQQLNCVFAQRQRHAGFGLTGAKMKMMRIVSDRLVERRQRCVDQQVMMAGVGGVESAGATPILTRPKWSVTRSGSVEPSLTPTK